MLHTRHLLGRLETQTSCMISFTLVLDVGLEINGETL
jgi:hypothetical protein